MKLYILLILTLFSFSSQAKAFEYGILGGLNLYSPSYSDPSQVTSPATSSSSSSAFGLSVSTGLIPLITLEADLLYVTRSASFTNGALSPNSTSNLSFHALEIPVMARISIIPIFFNVGGGLYYAMALGSVNKAGSDIDYSAAGINKTEVGALLAAELKIPALTFFNIVGDARYQFGFTDLSKTPASVSLKTRELQFFAGVEF